jgi:hypothetical protein
MGGRYKIERVRRGHMKEMWRKVVSRRWSDDRVKQTLYATGWECGYCFAVWIRESRPASDELCDMCDTTENEFEEKEDELIEKQNVTEKKPNEN